MRTLPCELNAYIARPIYVDNTVVAFSMTDNNLLLKQNKQRKSLKCFRVSFLLSVKCSIDHLPTAYLTEKKKQKMLMIYNLKHKAVTYSLDIDLFQTELVPPIQCFIH